MKWTSALLAAILGLVLYSNFAQSATLETKVETTAGTSALRQESYRWYENADAGEPVTPRAAENAPTQVPLSGGILRLRINLAASGGLDVPAGQSFKLQYFHATSSATSSSFWRDVGTGTQWVFHNNASVSDGAPVGATILSNSHTGESYSESNPTVSSPTVILQGQRGEWDWAIKNNTANPGDHWAFRMVYASGTELEGYSFTALPFLKPPPAQASSSANVPTSGGSHTFTMDNNRTCTFNFPTNFYDQTLEFRAQAYSSSTFTSDRPPPSGVNFVGNTFDFNFYTTTSTLVTSVNASATITCTYLDADVAGYDESTLRAYRLGVGESSWSEVVGSSVDASLNTITFSTASFSSFALMGESSSGEGSAPSQGGSTGFFGPLRLPLPPSHAEPPVAAFIIDRVDINGDRMIDMRDFSILLYHFGEEGEEAARYDLNENGNVDMADVSIMLYYWTV